MRVQAVGSSEELKTILQKNSDRLTVIDFHATWCGPCKMIAPKIADMAGEITDVLFLKVDVDEYPEIAEEYGISFMPTFKFIKDNKVLCELLGANDGQLKQKIMENK